jgi:hypothetical protein
VCLQLTLSLTQHSEESNLHKCFRKIGLLVDAYRQTYKKIAQSVSATSSPVNKK